jgi:uncharacterized protein (DUF1778 family)
MPQHTRQNRDKCDIAMTVRISEQERTLIDRAAKTLGMSRTAFLLESACNEAQNVLLDTNWFGLNAKDFKTFCERLNAPPPNLEGLRRMLTTKAAWE